VKVVKIKSFSISIDTSNTFDELCEKLGFSKSQTICNLIDKWIKEENEIETIVSFDNIIEYQKLLDQFKLQRINIKQDRVEINKQINSMNREIFDFKNKRKQQLGVNILDLQQNLSDLKLQCDDTKRKLNLVNKKITNICQKLSPIKNIDLQHKRDEIKRQITEVNREIYGISDKALQETSERARLGTLTHKRDELKRMKKTINRKLYDGFRQLCNED